MNKLEEKIWDITGLSFWSDWTNIVLWKRFNWVNFRVIGCDIEWDKMDNSFNLEIGLLGFNIRWQKSLPGETKQRKKLLKRIKEMM